MDELLIRVLRGNASEFERQQILAWRRASLDNEKRFRELSQVWGMAGVVEPVEYAPVPAVDAVLERASATGSIPAAVRRRAMTLLTGWVGRGIAAAALLAAGFGAADLLVKRSDVRPFGAEEFVTGPSQTVTVSLRDGSVVRLGPQSRLRLRGGAESGDREVSLEGRAYFAVAKDPNHPFRVRTRAGEARVLGTQFDLSVVEGDLRLVVVEGRVRLSAGGSGVEVKAGQVSRVIDGAKPTVVSVREPMVELGWVADLLVFQATPLEQVIPELEKRYKVRITPIDSGLGKRQVSAWFSGKSLEEVLTVVCRVVEANCSIDGQTVTIEH